MFWKPRFNMSMRLTPTRLICLPWWLYCIAQLIIRSFRSWRTAAFLEAGPERIMLWGLAQTPAEDGACGARWRTRRRSDRGVRRSKPVLCWRCPRERCSDTPHPVRTTTLHGSPAPQRHIHVHVLSLLSQPSLTMSVVSHKKMTLNKQTHTMHMYMWMYEEMSS